MTLAWFAPVRPSRREYRQADLWFEIKDLKQLLSVDRHEADGDAVRRGTVQHEVFEGKKASVFSDGDAIEVTVSARELVGHVAEPIPYGLAVTLETAPGLNLPIYQEVRERVALRVGVRHMG